MFYYREEVYEKIDWNVERYYVVCSRHGENPTFFYFKGGAPIGVYGVAEFFSYIDLCRFLAANGGLEKYSVEIENGEYWMGPGVSNIKTIKDLNVAMFDLEEDEEVIDEEIEVDDEEFEDDGKEIEKISNVYMTIAEIREAVAKGANITVVIGDRKALWPLEGYLDRFANQIGLPDMDEMFEEGVCPRLVADELIYDELDELAS